MFLILGAFFFCVVILYCWSIYNDGLKKPINSDGNAFVLLTKKADKLKKASKANKKKLKVKI